LEHRLLLSIAPRPQVRPSVPTLARGFLLAMGVKEEETSDDMGGHS
jgi:hypothetical protein